MARDRSPIAKQSRREGHALHAKAHKIILKKPSPPGQVQRGRRNNPSQFAIQLREKQKVKRLYGLLERQFKRLVNESGKTQGKSGEVLLQLLERRLDNVVYRAGFARSRRGARQLVSHGHFTLNGKRVTIPSLRVNPGDVIAARSKSLVSDYFKNHEELMGDSEDQSASWLKADKSKFEIKITGEPQREDAEANISEQLIVEYYSR
ncbi:MAG TPA: 30S ribosomal protein S4 [Candidatus Saccharimonadales bacterium]|jgi:small subunit ribosomal protein S4